MWGSERYVHPDIPPGYWRWHAYKRDVDATREAHHVIGREDQPAAREG
jgi:hypothetical protein